MIEPSATKSLLVIAGPTASGKTSLALELAKKYPLKLISADSMQVYRGMDIGTAKPGPEDRKLFSLINIANPGESYSAGRFVRDATPLCEKAWKAGQIPCIVGGTGLYIRALIQGMADIPEVSPKMRKAVAAMSLSDMVSELQRCDPATAAKTDLKNPRRVSRALEVYKSSGKGLTAWHSEAKGKALNFSKLGFFILNPDPEILRNRIKARVSEMLKAGWAAEAKALGEQYRPRTIKLTGAIGYSELLEFPESAAAQVIELKTLQYARRQRTWFKAEKEAKMFEDSEVALPEIRKFLVS